MKKRPIIGIAGNVLTTPNHPFGEYWRSYVNEDYITSVLDAGGVPFIIPINNDESVIVTQMNHIDGIIMTGGDNDVNPELYGQELSEKTDTPLPRRDYFDCNIEKLARKMKKPSLFICRGHQIAAVNNGGSLYQDLSLAPGITLQHHHHPSPDYPAHIIHIDTESTLFDILQKEEIWVNSFHHQLVKDVPQGYKVVARAPDGCIEAMEPIHPDFFYLSTQWHPEMMAAKNNEDMKKIFQRLIFEAKKTL